MKVEMIASKYLVDGEWNLPLHDLIEAVEAYDNDEVNAGFYTYLDEKGICKWLWTGDFGRADNKRCAEFLEELRELDRTSAIEFKNYKQPDEAALKDAIAFIEANVPCAYVHAGKECQVSDCSKHEFLSKLEK